jgi:hypothetical protein
VRSSPPSRRSFLAAAGGLLVAAACGGSRETSGAREGSDDDHHAPIPQGEGLSALLLATDVYASPAPQRFIFALAEGGDYASGPPATIAFSPRGGTLGDPIGTELHTAGLPEGRGIYAVEATFPEPGVWIGRVEADGDRAELAFEVAGQPTAPVPGRPAPRAPSPTVADPMGVDPLCTRDPDCSLHEASLDALVGAGKPVAALFATPARCQSQYCGPVLDELLTLVDRYRDRIAFVHVEIFRADTGTDIVSTVEAWSLATEPWLFGVDATGTVVSRLDGAFGGDEMERLLDSLAG